MKVMQQMLFFDVFDYILKPYSEERIISMLNKLEKVRQSDIELSNVNSNLYKYKKEAVNQRQKK